MKLINFIFLMALGSAAMVLAVPFTLARALRV
jgi:hypothetical protein